MQLSKNGMFFRLQGRMRYAFIKMSAASEIKHMPCQNNLFLEYNSLPELIKEQPKMGVAAS